MPPRIEQDVAKGVPNLFGRRQQTVMVAIGKYGPRAPENTVQGVGVLLLLDGRRVGADAC